MALPCSGMLSYIPNNTLGQPQIDMYPAAPVTIDDVLCTSVRRSVTTFPKKSHLPRHAGHLLASEQFCFITRHKDSCFGSENCITKVDAESLLVHGQKKQPII